jgi:hypothetical protein
MILAVFLIGISASAGAQKLLRPMKVNVVHAQLDKISPIHSAAKNDSRQFSADAWYSRMTPNQKAIFFPFEYEKELVVRNGAMAYLHKTSKNNVPLKAANTDYKFVGFNISLHGLQQFNVDPYAYSTLVVDSSITEYSYYNDGKYVSFMPITDSSTGKFNYMDCITYDTESWQKDDSVRIAIKGQGDVPYMTVYDNHTGLYYCITMETTLSATDPNSGDYYYLNILNPTTCKMSRIGKICSWILKDDAHQESINGAVVINGEIYGIDNYNRLVKIDKTTAALTVVGKMKIGYANDYLPDYNEIVGLQGMAYEKSTGDLIISHLDWLEGAALYRIHLNSISDGVIASDKITDIDNSYLYMYTKPDANENSRLMQPSAFNVTVDDNMLATLSFTAPTKLVSGTALPTDKGVLKAKCTVDGNTVDLGNASTAGVKPGENVTSTFPLSQGLHTVSVTISAEGFDSSVGDILTSDASGAVVYAGYDAPMAPTNAKLSINNNKASISWTAPTAGKNAQFGAKFDANDITYTVIRNYDNHTVADGLKTTSVTDDNLGDVMHTYIYSVIAKSRGAVSDTVFTNSVVNGQYVNLPYMNKFEDSQCLDFFTVHNPNNDGTARSWSWNYVYKYVGTLPASTSINNNYYMYTPNFDFDVDHVYLANFDFTARGNEGETKQIRFNLSLSKDTLEDNTQTSLYTYEGPMAAKTTKHVYFRIPTSSKYRLSFRDYSPLQSSDYGGYVNIDNLNIDKALSVSAPDSVTALKLTRGANGALNVTLSFNAPSKTIDGKALTSIDAIKVFKGDALVKTISNPVAGSNQSVNVDATNDVNTYTIAAYNANGEGWPVEVSAFVGADVPNPVDSLNAVWGESDNDVEMTWQAPKVGENGGYVNTSSLTYNVYKFDNDSYSWDLLEKDIKTTNYTREETLNYSQDYVTYAVSPSNSVGEGGAKYRGIFLGKGYSLPFAEPFSGSSLKTGPWLEDADNDELGWNFDNGLYDAAVVPVANDSLKLMLMSTNDKGGGCRLITPIFDLTKYENPAVAVYLYHEKSCSDGSYCRIDATTDGYDFTPLTDKITVNDNAGWVKHVFALNAVKGKRVQLGLYGFIDKASSRIFADSISVYNLSGTDLAASAISYDRSATNVGKTATVNVIVSNRGAKDVSDYTVDLYANNTVVGEEMPDEMLKSGAERTFSFTVPVTAGTDTIACFAKVIADNDEVADNNQSDTLALVPQVSTLPAPQNLVGTLQGNVANLSWSAPMSSEGLDVTDDFETEGAFTLDNFNGWTTYDNDHQNTLSMIRLYDNYWPNAHLPQAWMVWNADKALATSSYFNPKDGKQCLISWGSNGVLADGFKSLDGYVNDDWLISPEIKGGSTIEFDAYATGASLYGNSTLEILTSSTDTKPASFSLLKSSSVGSTDESWQHFSYTLPSDAKYVAIRNTFTQYAILLDNLKYTLNINPVFKGYNMYHNSAMINGDILTATNYGSAKATGKYGVSAVYDLGESVLSNIVDIDVLQGISNVNSNVSVYVADGVIYVSGANTINVFTTSGMQVKHIAKVANSTEKIKVVPGVYIVKTDKGINKVIVK